MTKQAIVDRLAEGTGMPRPEVTAVVDGFLAIVMDALSSGDRVELRRFGVWKPVFRKGRHLRTPDGLREMDLPDRPTAVFVPASEFRARMLELSPEKIPH